ncbi:methylenetetrahydrofolate reductase [Vampirovibrio sp.]|uniref:methylenetetrahydrofolate reductase n=1 Tax=Vampirovibrio sp. TaxID=2717857 RepID=UPI003592F7AB
MSLRDKLASGQPVITVELSPPKGTDVTRLLENALALKGKVDAINVPDCQLSMLKMSSMATSKLIQDHTGIEAVWQLTCRDRNLIALQADLLGGYALGLRNVLALTGDPVQIGDQKEFAKQVFHLESVRLLDLMKTMNNGKDACGQALKGQGTDFTIGAAINPFKLGNRAQQLRLKQKIEREIHFFQTQPVYHPEPVEQTLALLQDIGHELGCQPPKLLLGIIPPRSAQAARRMNQEIVGVNIPESFIEILERSSQPVLESIRYCADVVHQLKPMADGFHFMPVGMASKVGLLLDACFAVSST